MDVLKDLTWTQYFILIGISLMIYYTYVIFRYFSPQVQQLFKARPGAARFQEFEQSGQVADEVISEEEAFVPVDDELFDRAQELLNKLKIQINAAAVGGADNSTLAAALRNEIKNYPELNIQAFRPGINYTIHSECGNHGSVMLDEREIERLWTS